MKTETLIEILAADLRRTTRCRSPWVNASLFLGFASLLGLMIALLHRAAFAPSSLVEQVVKPTLTGALLTGIFSSLAAFMLGQPDRSRTWAFLPTPAIALWLGSMSYQCITYWIVLEPGGMAPGEAARCFATFFMMAVPLGLLSALMLRRLMIFEPTRITLVASLAVAGVSAATMSVFHPYDASLMILIFNLGAALIILTAGWLLGRLVLARS